MNCTLLACSLLFAAAVPVADDYRLPPDAVVALADAEPAPSVRVSPDGRWMLLVERDPMPSIADLSRRMLRLAGMRIDPAAESGYRTSFDKGLVLRDLLGTSETRVPLGDGARLAWVSWSHNSTDFAFAIAGDGGTSLFAASTDAADKPRRLTTRLSTVTGSPTWMPDGERLLCRLVPSERGLEPPEPRVPSGPNVRETAGESSPLRTYQDLLTNEYDSQLFEHYARTQLALFEVRSDAVHEIGEVALFASAAPSPDGQHLLVTRVTRPFSYVQSWRTFPRNIAVWNTAGEAEAQIADIPLSRDVPIGGVPTGPRSMHWKASEGARLMWLEALDGGDPKREADFRDRWMTNAFPFTGEALEVVRLEQRGFGLTYFADPSRLVTTEFDRDRRWIRSLLHNTADPEGQPLVLDDRAMRDRYADPGSIVSTVDERGQRVVRQDGPWIYRRGSGASPEGLLPFLDRFNVLTSESDRIWRCEPGRYEMVVAITSSDPDGGVDFVTRSEAPDSPPNYYLRASDEAEARPLTSFPDPTPQLRGVSKQLLNYERADGTALSGMLYLPAGHQAGTRLPLLVWAYPIEFNDPGTAGQVTTTPSRFTRIAGSSHLNLVTQGYAILDGATIPIIGDPETMNDTFIDQLVAGAAAAIDAVVELGVADRERVAVGGHSYGAFMTANLLAHCDLFKAGIARSGAYNRTLTPFGFQSERRPFWEAPMSYFAISPFMHADKIKAPLLMTHGEMDNNSGTFPIQSERMFQAIKGNGGTARLVMLPRESHGYRARESVLHVLAEMIDWLDVHVKGAGAE